MPHLSIELHRDLPTRGRAAVLTIVARLSAVLRRAWDAACLRADRPDRSVPHY